MNKTKTMNLQKKIDKIEDTDSNFKSNKQWQELRKEQDKCYYENSKELLARDSKNLEHYNGVVQDLEKNMAMCRTYIKSYEKEMDR